MTDTPTPPEATFVYLGRHLSGKNKVFHAYARHPFSGMLKDRLLYSRPIGTGKRGSDTVGGLYIGPYDAEEGTAYNAGGWRYEGMIDDDEERAKLFTQDRLTGHEIKALAERKKAKKANPLFEALDPIREAYATCYNATARRKLMAEVMEYIAAGR